MVLGSKNTALDLLISVYHTSQLHRILQKIVFVFGKMLIESYTRRLIPLFHQTLNAFPERLNYSFKVKRKLNLEF